MRTKNILPILFILIIAIATASAGTENTNDDSLILLKTGYIDTDNTDMTIQDISTISTDTTEGYYIVQFTGPVKDIWKQEMAYAGASIQGYVPNNAFIFMMTNEVKDQIGSFEFVKWVGEYRPSYKYDPQLTQTNSIQTSSTDVDTENIYFVLLFSSDDYESTASSIELLGGNILSGSEDILKVQVTTDIIPEIAAMTSVSWIEEYVQPTISNDIAADIINATTTHETYGLNGSGQIIAVADSGLDTGVNDSSMHADIRGRIVSIIQTYADGSSADYNGHGTHVAGSVLGNGSLSDGQYSGIAPEARLVFQALGDNAGSSLIYVPSDLKDLFQEAYNEGAKIHTNSWGGASNGAYTTLSLQVDQFVWEHPDMLILFAAGNSGVDPNEDGVIDEYSIDYPATAKNCLTVGASENERGDTFSIGTYSTWGLKWPAYYPASPIYEDYMADDSQGIAAFSSRGPTQDGRIKPDVVAPGTFIISTRSSLGSATGWGIVDDNYLYMGGTSMATPITAGSAALIRQYYTDVENLTSPSAALLKATIINGAMNITPGQYGTGATQEINGIPDNSSGWGRVDIENSIYPQYPDVIEYFDNPQQLNLSDSWNVSYNVTEGSDTLKATLVWTDHYNLSESAEKALINDLDLIIVAPDDTYYGNNGPDTVNNVEGIELADPTPGTYTIKVNGTAVQIGPQNFSLVIYSTFDINEYPSNGSYTTNGSTAVSLNLSHPYGINQSTINMTIDSSEVIHSLESITGGYKVENVTAQPYIEGYHNVSVTALTNQSEEISYDWQFYASVEDNIITIDGLAENSVLQEETFEINISNNKYCDLWYNIDNGNNSSIETGFSFNTTLNLTEGQYNLTVFAEDITGYVNSTTVNFTVFTTQPTIDLPDTGTIYYHPDDNFSLNGTAGIATNVSVYINGNLTNGSWPVSNGVFNLTNIPLSNGTNTVNVTSIFNNSETDHLSSNTTIYLSLGETFDTTGYDEVTFNLQGLATNVSDPAFNFNITGTPSNPGNISAAVVRGNEPGNGSVLTGSAIDIRVINESDPEYSYQFGRNVSLTLGYDHILVNDTDKLAVAWYDPDEGMWIPFRSTVNITAHTVTTNITHLSIYAPVEDNTAPVISDLENSRTSSSITLSWNGSDDTDHVEVWKNGVFLNNVSDQQISDTGLSASTSYSYGLRPIDFTGNIGNWTNTTVATTASTTTSSSGGGGGGGGGGGSSGEEYENIGFKDVLTVYAGKDDIVNFDFDDEKNDIDYVRYLSLKNAGKISTTIEILKDTSALVDDPVPGKVYRNLNIWVGKTGYAIEANIQDPIIGFRVSKEWIQNNNIDVDTIALNRYSDDTWGKLSTEQSGSDDEYIYFEASTPGFSPFAITADEPDVIEDDEAEQVADISDASTETEDTDTTTSDESGKLPALSGIVTIAILAVTCVLIRKQQN
ncbi:PGF-pre-PGF domain-containing protein [Methanolobus profundi]|uniref:PGF-pre-PGF domain-containing protein n=1 Tax=Methanolobus profundi TaxID=487685 RepID=A0A1I4UUZ2_9EURY|nr:PGF-pre-PGF domain-containing protein [Methanolobus profundi]SFM92837.1 PGF-pre-PGF domain-containing protein [Methanolobus profundi]